MTLAKALAGAVTLLFVARAASAQSLAAPGPRALAHTTPPFLAFETAGAAAIYASYALAAGGTSTHCSWCTPTGFDVWVRRQLETERSRPPATISHVLSYGIIPVGAAASVGLPAYAFGRVSYAWQDAWIISNGFLLTLGISQGTKRVVARRRPAYYYGRQAETEYAASPSQENLSFFSGDTAAAFSVASSAATLCYLHGYRSAPWVAAGGAVLASSVGVLRIAADMHWATDVMAGAFVGTAVGVGLPLLLHQRTDEPATETLLVPLLGDGVRGVLVTRSF
jgi:membrane-associated phospholipid phosphatase